MNTTPKQRRLSDFFGRAKSSSSPACSPLYPTSSSPNTSSGRKRRFGALLKGQMTLDAGQKFIGGDYCSQCGMVFSVDVPEDVAAHKKFHARALDDIPPLPISTNTLNSWKKKTWWLEDESGMLVFRVTPGTEATLLSRFENIVKEFVNPAVGYSSSLWTEEDTREGWLAVKPMQDGFFCACIILTEVASEKEECVPSTLGVNRIWTHPSYRGKGVARTCLDVARLRFLHADVLPRQLVAFCEPTQQGQAFAKAYSGRENGDFLVYALSK